MIKRILDERLEKACAFEDTEQALSFMLSSGCSIWTGPDGQKALIETRALVDRIDNLKICVYANEHTPPHFHVIAPEIDASFAISDGRLLKGRVSRKDGEIIVWWFQQYRTKLVQIWNQTRPTNCPVGRIIE